MEDWYEYLEYEPDFWEKFDNIINNSNVPEANSDFTSDVFDDMYFNMELAIPRYGYEPEISKVTKRLRDKDGLLIDRDCNNPILDTIMYEEE